MSQRWFCKIGAEQLGPVSAEELRRLAQVGEIGPRTPIRRDDMTRWVQAARVRGLLPSIPDRPVASGAASSSGSQPPCPTPAVPVQDEPRPSASATHAAPQAAGDPPRMHLQRTALGVVALSAAVTVTGLAIWNGGAIARLACIVAWISLLPMSLVFVGHSRRPLSQRAQRMIVVLKMVAAIGWLLPLLSSAFLNWGSSWFLWIPQVWDAGLDWLHSFRWIRSVLGWFHAPELLPSLRIGKTSAFPEGLFVVLIAEAVVACVLGTLGGRIDLGSLLRGWKRN